MLELLQDTNIAIIGGGRFCRAFLQFLIAEDLGFRRPTILGVADRNERAEGVVFAREKGIFTTTDYQDLFRLPNLEVLIELTNSNRLAEVIRKEMPEGVQLIDHIDIRSVWSVLQIRREKVRTMRDITGRTIAPDRLYEHFDQFADRIEQIVLERTRRYQEIEREFIENRRAISQIVDGSTIPTFVIDAKHVVTHWNKACERLTGYPAEKVVGTDEPWRAFRSGRRPLMADLILDGVGEEEVLRYYGKKWRKSALIEGAYEAEEYFPLLGEKGKWLYFTAAPIKASDGKIIGAIETLWDKTAEKEAEEQLNRHNKMLAETARELAKSEKTLAQIIQGSTAPTFVIDKNHIITHWNRALENLTGYPAEEMIGTRKQWMPFWDRERPSMADVILDQLDESKIHELYGGKWRSSPLIEGGYEAEEFFPRLGKDGKWCFFTAAPIKGPDGSIVAAIETLWDRTEHKKAEEERERHTRELAALNAIYTALSVSDDLNERLERASKEISSYLDADAICLFTMESDGRYSLRYTYGNAVEVCDKNRIDQSDSMISRVASSGKTALFEDIGSRAPKGVGYLARQGLRSLAYIPIKTKGKKVFGVIRVGSRKAHHFTHEERNVLDLIGNRIGVAIENSMLKEQYIKSEEKYRTLFDSAPNQIFILDSCTCRILDINQRAQDHYGYSREELLGMHFLDLGDREDEELTEGLEQACRGSKFLFFTKKRHYRKDGTPFYVNINISSAKYGDNYVINATTTDITESVEKETQLVQASKMTTLGTMAAGMAHEINQPLNVIQVCADFFLKMINKGVRISDEELKTLARDISDNVQRAAGIIKHMRDFARQSEVVTTQVNINDPIRDVFKVMGHQLKVHQIKLKLDLDPDIPPILAEHNRLEQVFINLVTNAVDAMDEKGTQMGVEPWERILEIRSFAEGDQVVVTVTDTGTGMPQEIIDKIFEPFFTTKEVGKGTGLGVSISYGIVKDYNGTIDIRSEPGVGTTFELRFPAHKPKGR